MERPLRVLIIGGGIGGLTTAIALRRAGHEPIVFEQAPELREIGAGLTLWSNAVRVLDKLGVGDALRALAPPDHQGGIFHWRGKTLLKLSPAAYAAHYGAPNIAVHRADLQSLLLMAADPSTVRLNHHCTGFTQDDTGVTARFDSAPQQRGDALVGADGIHTIVREQLIAELLGPSHADPLRYAGYTCWRGVCTFPHDGLLAGETLGPGARFGMVPLSRSRIYWFATQNAAEGRTDPPPGAKAALLSLFGDWREPIPQVIQATDDAAILRRDLYDRRPLPRWSLGRVTLLGDAAHPTTPNLGQGACQAIEDALALADCLSSQPDVPAALSAYEARRISHTTAIVNYSRLYGRIGQMRAAPLRWLRDSYLSLLSPDAQMRRLAWVLGHEV